MATLLEPLAGDQASRIADELLSRFGSVSRILDAPQSALKEALGEQSAIAAAIAAARGLVTIGLQENLVGKPVDIADPRLHEFLRCKLVNPDEERLHVIFLDDRLYYLASQTVARGGRCSLTIPVKRIMKSALNIAAGNIILAHNHPSGSCRPSQEDHDATDRIVTIASSLEISVLDHLITSSDGTFSMRQGRVL